jgi:ribosomal protein S6
LNRYEALVILPERLTEDEVEQGLDTLCKEIKDLGGTPTRPTRMGRKPFAREMDKQTAGEYALLNMTLKAENVAKLLEALKHNEAIFRIQISRKPEVASAEPAAATAED